MAELVINKFRGIAPRIRSAEPGSITYAEQATNVDLYGETLRPLKGDEDVSGETGHTGSEIFYSGQYPSGTWESGKENYLQGTFDDVDILFFKDSGVFKRKIGGVTTDLGLARPDQPTLTSEAIATPTAPSIAETTASSNYLEYGTYVYYVTFSKFVSTGEIESEPSAAADVSAYFAPLEVGPDHPNATLASDGKYYDLTGKDLRYHVISRPSVPAGATQWNLYRSDNGDDAKLISSGSASGIGEGYDVITDRKTSAARGRELETLRPDGRQYRFNYIITWVRLVGAYEDESGPSNPKVLRVPTLGVKVERPLVPPANVTAWRIYRIDTEFDPTTTFQLVAEVPIATTSYIDAAPNADLGDEISSSFTTEDGTEVNFEPPEDDLEGMVGPHQGMLFAWKGSDLYYTEPGLPDAWPAFNKLTLNGRIVGAEVSGSELLVFLKNGVQRIVGNSPQKLLATRVITQEGAVARKAILTFDSGTVYLSESGLNLVSGSVVRSLTDSLLGEDFFTSINSSSTFLAYNDGRLYLFHDAGGLLLDTRVSEFVTLDKIYTAAYRLNETGNLYVLQADGIIKVLHGATDELTYVYKTGELVLDDPQRKRFRKFELSGTGTTLVELFADGNSIQSRVLDMDGTRPEMRIFTPHGTRARAGQVKLTGEGEVTEIKAEVFEVV